jgi:hypothetical protein
MATPRLTPFSWGRIQEEGDDSEAAPKRISTPAGLRLSSIINTEAKETPESPSFASRFSNSSFSPRRLSLNAGKRFSGIRVVDDVTVEEQRSKFKEDLSSLKGVAATIPPSPEYGGSSNSEKSVHLLPDSPSEKTVDQARNKNTTSRRRIIIALVILFLILLAVIIGLAVGLSTKKHKSR